MVCSKSGVTRPLGSGWHRGQAAEKERTRHHLTPWHYKLCSCPHPLFSIIYFEHLDQQFVQEKKKNLKNRSRGGGKEEKKKKRN